MEFIASQEMKVSILLEQEVYLSSREKIKQQCRNEDVLTFDILMGGEIIGFAMLRQFDENSFFLWNYAIDMAVQNRGYGKKALQELISHMCECYSMRQMTTTYIYGNVAAERLYRSLGFEEIGIVEEEGCHEVDMRLNLSSQM